MMVMDIFSWVIVALTLLASSVMLIRRDWRIQLGALAVQYFAAFWLVARHWPLAMASTKLVTGWMVVVALGMTRINTDNLEEPHESFGPGRQWFSVILVCIVSLVVAGATPQVEAVIPGLGLQVIAGGLLLIGAGLIHLGLTSDIFRIILGLLTLLTGFEIIYAALESSILVAGLLAVINLGLGLVGAYLLTAGTSSANPLEEEEQL